MCLCVSLSMWVPVYLCESACECPQTSEVELWAVTWYGNQSHAPCESSKCSQVLNIIPALKLSVYMCKVCLTMVVVKNKWTKTLEHGTWDCCPRYGCLSLPSVSLNLLCPCRGEHIAWNEVWEWFQQFVTKFVVFFLSQKKCVCPLSLCFSHFF